MTPVTLVSNVTNASRLLEGLGNFLMEIPCARGDEQSQYDLANQLRNAALVVNAAALDTIRFAERSRHVSPTGCASIRQATAQADYGGFGESASADSPLHQFHPL